MSRSLIRWRCGLDYPVIYSGSTQFSTSRVSNQLFAHPPVLPHPPTPPVLVEGPPVYKVKKLLATRPRGRGFQYLVDWEGYGPEERSWVPARDILDRSLIEDFLRSRQSSSSGAPGGAPRGRGTVMSRVWFQFPFLLYFSLCLLVSAVRVHNQHSRWLGRHLFPFNADLFLYFYLCLARLLCQIIMLCSHSANSLLIFCQNSVFFV